MSYVDIPFEGLIGALQLNQIDAAVAAISVTPEREGSVDFTDIYFVGEDGLLARQDSNLSPIRSADEMAKLRVGVQRGSVYETWLNAGLVSTGKMPIGNFFTYTQMGQALDDLKANRLDVVMMDYLPAQDAVKQGGVKLVGRGLAKQNYAMTVRKGSLSLRNNLNQTLAQMQIDGTVTKLAQQYLGVASAPIVPITGIGDPPKTATPAPSPATAIPPPTPTAAPGISFTADRTSIKAGERVVLSWNVTNVKAIYLYVLGEPWAQRGVSGQDTRQVYLQNTTVYELRVVKPDDQVETRQIRIDVTPEPNAPVIARFTVDPSSQISAGQCVNLMWDVQGNVSKVTLISAGLAIWDNAPVRATLKNCPSGSGSVSYVIDATGPGGSNRAQRDITVIAQPTPVPQPPTPTIPPSLPTPTVRPSPSPTPTALPAPVINVFSINPGAVTQQQCATLSWDVSGSVNSVRIFRGGVVILDNGMLTGTAQECPTAPGNLLFRIEVRNLTGQVTTRELTLIVNP